jgi:hypothetical protein
MRAELVRVCEGVAFLRTSPRMGRDSALLAVVSPHNATNGAGFGAVGRRFSARGIRAGFVAL